MLIESGGTIGNVVEKTEKKQYIYNIESDPSRSAFKFQIKVLAASNHDPYNAIGVRNPKMDQHPRCAAGACVQLETGKIWVNGKHYAAWNYGTSNCGNDRHRELHARSSYICLFNGRTAMRVGLQVAVMPVQRLALVLSDGSLKDLALVQRIYNDDSNEGQ